MVVLCLSSYAPSSLLHSLFVLFFFDCWLSTVCHPSYLELLTCFYSPEILQLFPLSNMSPPSRTLAAVCFHGQHISAASGKHCLLVSSRSLHSATYYQLVQVLDDDLTSLLRSLALHHVISAAIASSFCSPQRNREQTNTTCSRVFSLSEQVGQRTLHVFWISKSFLDPRCPTLAAT